MALAVLGNLQALDDLLLPPRRHERQPTRRTKLRPERRARSALGAPAHEVGASQAHASGLPAHAARRQPACTLSPRQRGHASRRHRARHAGSLAVRAHSPCTFRKVCDTVCMLSSSR